MEKSQIAIVLLKANIMNLAKCIFCITIALVCIGCSKLNNAGYSLDGYNNSGYSGDYQHQGGYDDTSIEEARKERERKAHQLELDSARQKDESCGN